MMMMMFSLPPSFVMMITFERNDGFYSKYRDATQTGHWVGEMK